MTRILARLGTDFERAADVAWHRTARIEQGAIVKGPAIIGPHCLVGAGAYLRGGVWLAEGSRIGANAVLAPGTLLAPGSIVPRLGLIDQGVRVPRRST